MVNEARPLKLAVLSHIFPPSPSGQSIVLYRLLRDLDPDDYCLLSWQNYDARGYVQNSPTRFRGRYYHLRPGVHLIGRRFRIIELVDILLQVLQRARSIARIVKREKCGAIIACSGDLIDLPAGYLASRWARVPFYVYLFDDYLYQWTNPLYRGFARYAESILIKDAAGVIVPNEFLCDEYRRRYQVESTIVRNPCDVPDIEQENKVAWPAREGEIKIVYTGAVYQAHYDAFRNLIAAIQQIGRLEVKLHIYSEYSEHSLARLKQNGICGPAVVFHQQPEKQSYQLEVQRQADILFLPLAFDSPYPELIKTSAPGKMGEYLASRRPVLAHAPADSFVSWYLKKHECGLVVDQNDPTMLVQAIRFISENADARARMVENARVRAATDFSIESARAAFFDLFQPKAMVTGKLL